MRHVLSILFGAAFTVGTAWALGRVAFHWLRIRLERFEHELLAGVVGSALLSSVIFGFCALRIASIGSFLGLGVVAGFLGFRAQLPYGRGSERRVNWGWAGIFAVYAFIYLVNSFAPEHSPDGQTYHLGLVYRFFRDHGFQPITTSFYANMPLGVEMLFLDAFSFGRQSAAATVECSALLALPFLMVSYGRRAGHEAAAAGAALLVFLAPIAGFSGSTAYNDVFLVLAAFAVFYLTEIWLEDRENVGLAVAIGIVSGFCFAIKYTGFPAVIYVVIALRRRPKALAIALAAAACIAGPWLVKNWIVVGNPFAPFLNRLFPNPYIHVTFEDFTRTWYRRYDVADLRPWAWMVTVTGRLGGQLGPWFLLAPVGLIALRWREGRRLLLAASVFLIPYPQNIAARFLLPALPFVALAMSLVLVQWRGVLPAVVAAAAVLAWPGLTGRYDTGGNVRIAGIPWKAALRITPQDEFMASHSVPWISARTLDTFVPAGKRVLTTTPVAEGYAKTDVMVTYQSAEGELLQDVLTTGMDAGSQPSHMRRFTFTARLMAQLRLVQTAVSATDVWSIGELRFYLGQQEVAPVRLDAEPFPFDIGLVWDRNPVTRWMAWQAMRGGMHVDSWFRAGTSIDRVEIYGSHDQGKARIHLEECERSCRTIPARLDEVNELTSEELRPRATAVLREHGIGYLFVDDGNWVAADIRKAPQRWNMTLIVERAGNRLYMLD